MSDTTPRPWYADPDTREGYDWNVHILQADSPNTRICFMTSDGPAEANAALIVHAVNNIDRITAERDAARKALEVIAQGGNTVHSIYPNTGPKTRDEMAAIAVRALTSTETLSSEERKNTA